MSDLNVSNFLKNNLTGRECPHFSETLERASVPDKNVSIKSSRSGAGETSCFTSDAKNFKEYITPGTEACSSILCTDSEFDEFDIHSADDFVLYSNVHHTASSQEPTKYRSTVEPNKLGFINKMKNSRTHVTSDMTAKYNLDKQGTSSNSKTRNSPNFSIFGQLLNKKQNSSFVSRNSGSCSNYSLPQTSRQSFHSLVSEQENLRLESTEGLQRAQMKTKLRSMWNNVKYGWRMKREVNLKTDSAIWLLGRCYHNKLNDGPALTQDAAEQLRLDLLSKIWLTYRINFPVIPGTNLISDSGWGCMLRSAQMMMAQAFVCHFLQRDWRLTSDQSESTNQLYKMILRWFGDSLSESSPFSLHHLVTLGENYGRKAGDWYGPTHAAHVLRDALQKAKKHHPILQQLCMYVASDGIVFKQDVMDLCMDLPSQEKNDSNSSLNSDFAYLSLSEVQGDSSNDILKDNPADFSLNVTLSEKNK